MVNPRKTRVRRDIERIKEAEPADVIDAIWEKMERKALSTFHLLLANEVLYNVASELIAAKL